MKNLNNIKRKAVAVFVMLSLIFSNGFAQDGAKLFKQNCAACHKVDKSSIGPKLQGAKSKWEEAGEGELLYEWVADPTGLYNNGTSQMAKEIWDFNPTAMTPMAHLSREEVDAIFAYTDAPPTEEPIAEANTETETALIEPARPLSLSEKTFITVILIFLIATIWVMLNAKSAVKRYLNPDEPQVENSLTGAVAIEEEETILLDHEYDGIRELDNVLPPWWVWMFYGTIIFSVAYVAIYHIFDTSPLQTEAYEIEMITANAEVEAYKLSAGMAIDEDNVELVEDENALAEGKTIYIENCAVCHGQKGEGMIGPNLTDEYWLYGGDVKKVFSTVKYGTKNGMPEHESKFNPLELQNVVSFIETLPFAEGKEPEGEKE